MPRDGTDPAEESGDGVDAGNYVGERVLEWLSGSVARDPQAESEALDDQPRRWDPVSPSATRIGRAIDPDDDIGDRLRDIHAERHPDLRGNERRRRRLDAARVAQAVCNSLDLTAWERDRVLGVVDELDTGAIADEDRLSHVVLVVARRVVDAERRASLALDRRTRAQPPERLSELAARLHRLTDSLEYQSLLADCGLPSERLDTLDEQLDRQLDAETLRTAALGRSVCRDPWLPAFE